MSQCQGKKKKKKKSLESHHCCVPVSLTHRKFPNTLCAYIPLTGPWTRLRARTAAQTFIPGRGVYTQVRLRPVNSLLLLSRNGTRTEHVPLNGGKIYLN